LEDGEIANAALLFFGKEPQRYCIQAKVRIGRFKDQITIIDDKESGEKSLLGFRVFEEKPL